MIWQNPWAWLGLIAVALPVIIHLFGRGHARVHRFPTLRFLAASRLWPTRRTRINDLLLLAVRASVLVVATAALARPLLLTARRSAAANTVLARAVIVDTSGTPADRAAIDSVNRATNITRDATTTTVISTGDVSSALPGALAWLETQPMRGEITIISRFPLGTLDSADLASIAPRFGVRLVRVPVGPPGPLEVHARSGLSESTTRFALTADRTDAEWSTSPRARAPTPAIELLAGAGEQRRADAARTAAASIPVGLPVDSASSIVVVEPGYETRKELLASAVTPRRDWMMDIVARVAADPSFAEAARRAAAVAPPDSGRALVVARTDSGRPVVLAGEGTVRDREQLMFFSLADAGSLTSAALLAAVAQTTSLARPARALEPSTIPDATLAAWQRPPATDVRPRGAASGTDAGESDGRWMWIVVLALLGAETWLRRSLRAAAASYEIAHDRAA